MLAMGDHVNLGLRLIIIIFLNTDTVSTVSSTTVTRGGGVNNTAWWLVCGSVCMSPMVVSLQAAVAKCDSVS